VLIVESAAEFLSAENPPNKNWLADFAIEIFSAKNI